MSQQQAKAKLEARSETEITRAILQALNLEPGVFAFRINVGSVTAEHKGKQRYVRFGFRGQSDIIGWKREYAGTQGGLNRWFPRWLALEVKRPDQVPNVLAGFVIGSPRRYLTTAGTARVRAEQQRAFLQRVRAAGGIAWVVTSTDEARAAVK